MNCIFNRSGMLPIKLTKLHFSEIKQEICSETDLIYSENHLTLQCSNNQLITLDISESSSCINDLPFNLYYAEIPKNQSASVPSKTHLRQYYEKYGILKEQRFSLQSSCVGHCYCERVKVNALGLKCTKWNRINDQPLGLIVTVCGMCRIVQKLPAPSRKWVEICSVDEYFLNKMLSIKSHNRVNECRITAGDWHKTDPILFVSFENGCIAALSLCNRSTVKFKECFIEKALNGEICNLISFEHFLIVCSRSGVLQLFSAKFTTKTFELTPLTVLWNRKDNIICSKILLKKFCPKTYLVVFNKAAHIFVFMLAFNGEVLSSTTFYIGGIKITGAQFISSTEFIITTITNAVRYFKVHFFEHGELRLGEHCVEFESTSPNLGIRGFLVSANCSLLTFVLIRCSEYSQQCKHMHKSVFVSIHKLERTKVLQQFANNRLGALNPLQDSLIALDMDIVNNINLDQYRNLINIMNADLPDTLDEGFLLQLQIKFRLVSSFLKFRRWKRKKNEESTIFAHELLFKAIQISHVLCRLKYLHSLDSKALSSFQQECINIFLRKYAILFREFKTSLSGSAVPELTQERYLDLFSKCFDANLHQKTIAWNERCLYCNDLTSPNTMVCDKNHRVKRCYVSYQQLPVISSRHCPRCQYYVLESKSLLQQLFTVEESIKCAFCRFLFVEDCV